MPKKNDFFKVYSKKVQNLLKKKVKKKKVIKKIIWFI